MILISDQPIGRRHRGQHTSRGRRSGTGADAEEPEAGEGRNIHPGGAVELSRASRDRR